MKQGTHKMKGGKMMKDSEMKMMMESKKKGSGKKGASKKMKGY